MNTRVLTAKGRPTLSGPWLRFTVAAALAASLAGAFGANTILHLFNDAVQADIDNLAQLSAAAIASLACAWTASRSANAERRGWTLLSISAGVWAIGQVIWTYYALVLNVPIPYPSAADYGFLSAVPFAFAGVLSFWTDSRGTATRWRVWLDGLIIVLALTFTGWALGLKTVAIGTLQSNDPLVMKLMNLAYPMGDILIGTVLILAIRRATNQQRGRMLLLLGGLAANSLADSTFDYLSNSGGYVAGDFLDTGWVLGYLMVAMAALWPSSKATKQSIDTTVDVWQLALPWTTVTVAGVVAVALALSGTGLDVFMTALAGITPILLTVSVLTVNRDSLAMLVRSRASASTLADVIARAPAGMVRIDPQIKVIDGNLRFAALLAGGEKLAGRPMAAFFSEDGYRQFLAKLQMVDAGNVDAVEGDGRANRLDGTSVWLHWGATVVRTPAGKTDYFIAMFEDTNARHEAEATAAANLGLMERLNHVKTEFLQSVSHEFKTALLGIQGFSELMSEADELNIADVKSFASDIHRDAERLDRLITEMLGLDQVESGQAQLNFTEVDINNLARTQARAADGKRGNRVIKVKLDPTLAPILGDAERLSDVIDVLLENAAMSSPADGLVTITTAASGSGVVVIVKDEGVGVRLEFDNRLFGEDDPYANSPIRKVVGTRLGLGIARQVIEMHGGRLSVVSPVGRGSEFRFTLPVLWRNRQGIHRRADDAPDPVLPVAV